MLMEETVGTERPGELVRSAGTAGRAEQEVGSNVFVVETARGSVRFPAYMPVTTFGGTYPVDQLIQPFLPRFADMMMVAYHWAIQMPPRHDAVLPVFVDSGGFACLLPGSRIEVRADGTGCIVCVGAQAYGDRPGDDGAVAAEDDTQECERVGDDGEDASESRITPEGVLELQEAVADFGATLDFPIPVHGIDEAERRRRVDLTLANARWAFGREARCARMFASVQGWDIASYEACARQMVSMGYRDLAIGGLVPRLKDRAAVKAICSAVKAVAPVGGLLHAFGVGEPDLVRLLFDLGVTSVDSSSYVRSAVSGRRWDGGDVVQDPTPLERAHCALMNLEHASRRLHEWT